MRLIDADALKLYFIANLCGHGTCLNPTGQAEVGFMIDEAPTIEAEPIVHAKWIKGDMNFEYDNYYCFCYNWNCSNCGETVSDRHGLPRRCPDCGAKMDDE